jgi:predicted amidohydrolase
LAALPEVANLRGRTAADNAEPLDGRTVTFLGECARELHLWIVGGSLLERSPEAGQRVFNTSVLLDPSGKVVAVYRKIHLFDVHIADGPRTMESATVAPGDSPVVACVGEIPVGLSVCYDLRFPELYRLLAVRGARVLFVPANFTAYTGAAHWHVLLRARAIENQAYVVAPAQIGQADDGISAFGHTMVVDPWGRIVAEDPQHETVVVADLDFDQLERVRDDLPSLRHRRAEAYAGLTSAS